MNENKIPTINSFVCVLKAAALDQNVGMVAMELRMFNKGRNFGSCKSEKCSGSVRFKFDSDDKKSPSIGENHFQSRENEMRFVWSGREWKLKYSRETDTHKSDPIQSTRARHISSIMLSSQ